MLHDTIGLFYAVSLIPFPHVAFCGNIDWSIEIKGIETYHTLIVKAHTHWGYVPGPLRQLQLAAATRCRNYCP